MNRHSKETKSTRTGRKGCPTQLNHAEKWIWEISQPPTSILWCVVSSRCSLWIRRIRYLIIVSGILVIKMYFLYIVFAFRRSVFRCSIHHILPRGVISHLYAFLKCSYTMLQGYHTLLQRLPYIFLCVKLPKVKIKSWFLWKWTDTHIEIDQ